MPLLHAAFVYTALNQGNVMRWALVCFLVLFATTVEAQAQVDREPLRGIGVGLRAGTLGPGFELSKPLSDRFTVRLGTHYIDYSHTRLVTREEMYDYVDTDQELFDAQIDGRASYFSVAGLIDWYPFRRIFRLTGGVLFHTTAVEMKVAAVSDVTFNNVSKTPEEVGHLGARLHFPRWAPYAGLGLGRADVGSRVTMLLDLGVLYSGKPRLDAVGSGMIGPTVSSKEGVEQMNQVEENLGMYRLYPVVSLGFALRL